MSTSPTRSLQPHRPSRRLYDAGRWLATTACRRWFFDRQAAFWLRELGPLGARWSFAAPRARVVEIIDETADTRTLVLDPGRRWPGHRAGQYVPLELEIDGVRVRRCYSISSPTSPRGARRIAITVRRVAAGRMSAALHRLGRGATLGLGAPSGEFVLGTAPAPRLLLVAGGSGITPIIAMIRELTAQRAAGTTQPDVVVIHASRGRHDAIFGDELASLATRSRWLQLHARRSDDPASPGRLDAAAVRALVPDLADREIFVCGPPGLIDVVTQAAAAEGALHRLHCERFVAPTRTDPAAPGAPAAPVTVALTHTGTRVVAAGPGPLLAQLERAGQRPAHGCRIGICHTCRCRKLRGTVEDSLTGAVSSEPDQDIRLCVSIARSDLELAL